MPVAPYKISALSREYVRVRVSATKNGLSYDPSADTVQMAFISGAASPQPSDFQPAIWETDTSTIPHTYRALCLVGPGGTIALPVGSYRVWVKVTDAPEIPVVPAGTLKVV